MRTLALTLALVSYASAAAAADTVFASGPLASQLTTAKTVCQVTNWGTKGTTMTNPAILDVAGQAAFGATTDTCTLAPLLFAQTCTFSFTNGTSGLGGGFITVKGSAKKLRGTCWLENPSTGAIVATDQMR